MMKYIFFALKIFAAFILFTGITFSGSTYYKPEPNRYECAGVQRNIARIDDRLRSGYKARTGEILRDKRRRLKKLKRACEKAGFKTTYEGFELY